MIAGKALASGLHQQAFTGRPSQWSQSVTSTASWRCLWSVWQSLPVHSSWGNIMHSLTCTSGLSLISLARAHIGLSAHGVPQHHSPGTPPHTFRKMFLATFSLLPCSSDKQIKVYNPHCTCCLDPVIHWLLIHM